VYKLGAVANVNYQAGSGFAEDGINIETIVDKEIYIIRGYNEEEGPPLSYTMVMFIIVKGTIAEAKATLMLRPPRVSQLRALRVFLKSLGCTKYVYERTDGRNLSFHTVSL